jgi:hypothetical protein
MIPKTAQSNTTLLQQLCKLIPLGLLNRLAKDTGVQQKARKFTPMSHVVAMLFAQLARVVSLSDLKDCLRLKSGVLKRFSIHSPGKNTLAHANKNRDSKFIENLFWELHHTFCTQSPMFAKGKRNKSPLHRFKFRRIHAMDSTVVKLVSNTIDWAKYRARKAADKVHVRLDLRTFLPSFVAIGKGSQNDVARATELCAGLKEGEIVLMDRGYNDYTFFDALDKRGVYWVTRTKDNMEYVVIEQLTTGHKDIVKDELVHLPNADNPDMTVRRVEAYVEVDGERRLMVFITNNEQWSPRTVCDMYQLRWDIEVFFKQIKQVLHINIFLGYSENAVAWQIYSALLMYLLLRYQAFLSKWTCSFTQTFTRFQAAMWEFVAIGSLMQCYGKATEPLPVPNDPQQAYFTGFEACMA